MKISKMVSELIQVWTKHGDIEATLQDSPSPGEPVTGYESFFIVPEEYGDGSGKAVVVCNIRWWPY